jgi:hypothetical protein
MAHVEALNQVGESLLFYLKNSYPKSLSESFKFDFTQVTTGDVFDKTPATSTLALILHRVSWNEHLRQRRASASSNQRGPLALDLHYLVSIWAKSPQEEQTVFAWALLQLHMRPLMDSSLLRGDVGWTREDQIEWIPEDLPEEQMIRIWDKLNSPYRLSAAYTARVLCLDPTITEEEYLPVVARQDTYRGPLEASER